MRIEWPMIIDITAFRPMLPTAQYMVVNNKLVSLLNISLTANLIFDFSEIY